jgi:site-specific recombinase XerD
MTDEALRELQPRFNRLYAKTGRTEYKACSKSARNNFSGSRVEDVDEFLAMSVASGWNRQSVSVAARALRAFFRYAETRGWVRDRFRDGH